MEKFEAVGIDVRTRTVVEGIEKTGAAYRVKASSNGQSMAFLVEGETDRVLGAHLVGPHVDEIMNLFALAIRQGLKATARKQTIFAYPTGASDIGDML
jgi:glutathione reductase (NADPH)